MIRKMILGVVVLAISAGLIYGGVSELSRGRKQKEKQISQKEIYWSNRETQRKATRGKGKIARVIRMGSKGGRMDQKVTTRIQMKNLKIWLLSQELSPR